MDDEEANMDKLQIAYISFAYDNCELISLLMKRGKLIRVGHYDKLTKVDTEIDELIKSEKGRNLTRPVKSFIIFET